MRTCLIAGDLLIYCKELSWGVVAAPWKSPTAHIAHQGVGSACLWCSTYAARYHKRDHHLVLTDRHVTSSGWRVSETLAASHEGFLLQGREHKPRQAKREGGVKGSG